MTTEYLKDIKFRNAVKRSIRQRVLGKTEYRRFAVRIKEVYGDDTLFEIYYRGGDWAKTDENRLREQLDVERQLSVAGFELVERDEMETGQVVGKKYYWRKAA